MAASVRASSKADSTTGTAISVSAPAGTTAGDFVVCLVQANGQTTIVDNNGGTAFTEDINDYEPNIINGHTLSVFSRAIVGGDPSTYAFTSGASGRWSIIAITFTDTASVGYDVAASTANAANDDTALTGTITVPSITTVADNAIHVVFCCWDTSSTGTITVPTGYTLLQSANSGGEPMSAAYKIITPAGATGTTVYANTEFAAMIADSFSIKGTSAAGTKLFSLLGVGS